MLAAILRPGNAGANNADDHLEVFEAALEQLPPAALDGPILARSDSAGASHALAESCRETGVRFSFGYAIDARVREAILALREAAWRPAINGDNQPREGAWVAELTDQVSLDAWPEGSRLIVRRERPHPGAQLSFTDGDGHRFQCLITDQPDNDLGALEARHRAHAIVEDRVRGLKSTGLSNLPFSAFEPNQAWLEAALCAHDLTVWTQLLLFDGEHAVCEPKRLRYRLLHVAGRLACHARRLTLHLPADWPWVAAIAKAFKRLAALPARAPATTSTNGPAARSHRPPMTAAHNDGRTPPTRAKPHTAIDPAPPISAPTPTETSTTPDTTYFTGLPTNRG